MIFFMTILLIVRQEYSIQFTVFLGHINFRASITNILTTKKPKSPSAIAPTPKIITTNSPYTKKHVHTKAKKHLITKLIQITISPCSPNAHAAAKTIPHLPGKPRHPAVSPPNRITPASPPLSPPLAPNDSLQNAAQHLDQTGAKPASTPRLSARRRKSPSGKSL